MADVEMTDAPTSAPVTKKKGGADGDAKEGKKRFEVKKVNDGCVWPDLLWPVLTRP
jgi:RING-box protein 1